MLLVAKNKLTYKFKTLLLCIHTRNISSLTPRACPFGHGPHKRFIISFNITVYFFKRFLILSRCTHGTKKVAQKAAGAISPQQGPKFPPSPQTSQAIQIDLENAAQGAIMPTTNPSVDPTSHCTTSTQGTSHQYEELKAQGESAQHSIDQALAKKYTAETEKTEGINFPTKPLNISEMISSTLTKNKEERDKELLEDSLKLLQDDLIQPKPLMNKNDVIKNAAQRGIVDFANAGKVESGGSSRVTPYGYQLDYMVSGSDAKIELKSSPLASLDSEVESSYHVVTTEIEKDTNIPRSDQMHMLIVKGDPQTDQTVEAISILTSHAAIKSSIGTIENIKLGDTQISGQTKGQFVAIMIPPREIQSDDCIEIVEGTDYINKPDILPQIQELDIEASKYESKPYNTEGFTTEKLQQLNDFHDDITENNEEVD